MRLGRGDDNRRKYCDLDRLIIFLGIINTALSTFALAIPKCKNVISRIDNLFIPNNTSATAILEGVRDFV